MRKGMSIGRILGISLVCVLILSMLSGQISIISGGESNSDSVLADTTDVIIDTEIGESRFTTYPDRDSSPTPYWVWVRDHDTFRTRAYDGNFWYTLCGEEGHNEPLYFGVWQASLPQSGEYEVFVWIPDPDPFQEHWHPYRVYTPTEQALYQVYHKDGATNVLVNQRLRTGDWHSLGRFQFDTSASIILNDRTGEPIYSTMVAYDAVRFVKTDGPPTPAVEYITITPKYSEILVGDSQSYTVEAFDQDGNSLGDVTASSAILSSPSGCRRYGNTVYATSAGTYTVWADYLGKYDTAILDVADQPLPYVQGWAIDDDYEGFWEKGLAGCSVYLDGVLVTSTDENGHFFIPDLIPKLYQVKVQPPPGYCPYEEGYTIRDIEAGTGWTHFWYFRIQTFSTFEFSPIGDQASDVPFYPSIWVRDPFGNLDTSYSGEAYILVEPADAWELPPDYYWPWFTYLEPASCDEHGNVLIYFTDGVWDGVMAIEHYDRNVPLTLWASDVDDSTHGPFGASQPFVVSTAVDEVGHIILIESLSLTHGPYTVGQSLTATFRIKNTGNAAITLDKLLLGGRYEGGELPWGGYPDFTYGTVTLNPGQTHLYEGTFTIPATGNYHFFIAYYIENPSEAEKQFLDEHNWNTCIDLGPGLTDADRTRDITVGTSPDNHPPVASALSISGQETVMYPDEPYTVTAKYFDPDGREDLKHCYLRLTHPSKNLTMMWYQAGGHAAPWPGEEGKNYLEIVSVNATPIEEGGLKGYELAWTFNISDQWPEVEDAIDFGVYAWDDADLKSGWKYDDTKGSFLIPPASLAIVPQKATIALGKSQRYIAIATDTRGSIIDVTADAVFGIDPGAGGTWAGNIYTSESAGRWEVTVSYRGLTDTATLAVYTGKIAYIPVRYKGEQEQDFPGSSELDTFNITWAEWLEGTAQLVSQYYYQQSYGLMYWTHDFIFDPWKELPESRDWWKVRKDSREKIIDRAVNMAQKEAGFDPSEYDAVVVILADKDITPMALVGKGKAIVGLEVGIAASNYGTWAHELGHAMADLAWSDYYVGSWWDKIKNNGDIERWGLMGTGEAFNQPAPVMSYNKEKAGWLEYQTVSSEGTYAVTLLHDLQAKGSVLRYDGGFWPPDASRARYYILEGRYPPDDVVIDNRYVTMRREAGGRELPPTTPNLDEQEGILLYAVQSITGQVYAQPYKYDNHERVTLIHGTIAKCHKNRVAFEARRVGSEWRVIISKISLTNQAVYSFTVTGAQLEEASRDSGSPAHNPFDVDLHVITSDGRMVGMDYDTGRYVLGIEGVEASGNILGGGPEWISVPAHEDVYLVVDPSPARKWADELGINPLTIQVQLMAEFYDSEGDRTEAPPVTVTVGLDEPVYFIVEDGEIRLLADVVTDPNTLNLRARGGVVTAYIELPEGFGVHDVDISTILLNGTVPALSRPTSVGDYNDNGIPDLMVKFDRRAVQAVLDVGESVEITITGEVGGIPFLGIDTIRVINR